MKSEWINEPTKYQRATKQEILPTHYHGIKASEKDEMSNILMDAYKPDVWMTLETFGKDKGASVTAQDKTIGKFKLFARRLANKTRQHIRYCLWVDRCPTSGKLHIHGTFTFEKNIIPIRDIERLWVSMVKTNLNQPTEKLSIGDWVDAVKREAKWKSRYACRVTNDKENIKQGLFYGFRKHEIFIDGSACPRKGSCKHRSCWLLNDSDWNQVLVLRYSNE